MLVIVAVAALVLLGWQLSDLLLVRKLYMEGFLESGAADAAPS